jgi:hypothetical protein
MCLLLLYLFSTKKQQQEKKRKNNTLYSDMQDGKKKIKIKGKKKEIKLNYRIETTILF